MRSTREEQSVKVYYEILKQGYLKGYLKIKDLLEADVANYSMLRRLRLGLGCHDSKLRYAALKLGLEENYFVNILHESEDKE